MALDYRNYLEQVIARRNYALEDIESRIDKLWLDGKLLEGDRDALMQIAAENAKDSLQIDIAAKFADIERRLQALEAPENEAPQYVVWSSGYKTAKGETVLRDIDGDGEYELCRYDGGRDSTGLDVGRIDGWHLVDEQGNVLGVITKADGAWTVTPIETPEPAEEEGE